MGGGALGREGPVIQMSASIFLIVGQQIRTTVNKLAKAKSKKEAIRIEEKSITGHAAFGGSDVGQHLHYSNILPSFDLRTWIVAGSAAGLAAAFNTPLAGVIFAIEELSQFHFEQQFSSFKLNAFFAVIVAGVTAQFLTGSYILFGFPLIHVSWQWDTVAVIAMLALICGLAAWIMKKTLALITEWRNSVTGNYWYLFPIICGLIVAFVSFTLGHNTFGAGFFAIKDSLATSQQLLTYKDSIGRFVNIIASSASGSAGGLLLPALAVGAGIGSVVSDLVPLVDARIFVATGMAAFLGALLSAPLTAAVLVFEVTNQREFIFPLFIATLIATGIFQTCNTVYEIIKKGRAAHQSR
jgi:H+/Cl- antiporter ClcA